MKLHYKEMGHGQPLLILHGLFGTLDNWQTLAKRFAEHYNVFLVDLRNHGRSPHSEQHDYDAMAADVLELVEELRIPTPAIMGHSMGGKVAMTYALRYPTRITKLIVVDIAPKAYPPHHDDIIEALQSVDLRTATSRSDIDAQLAKTIKVPDVRLFLMKNIYRKEDNSFGWRMNLEAIEQNYEKIAAAVTSDVPFKKSTLFIRGGRSNYIQPEDLYSSIEHLFTLVEIETIPEAGHWVHAQAPDKVYDLVTNFLEH
ncbi:pimeloyl-ACP methyl ester carboxylesterase [Pontibacter ummariensis]|uniref:Pimeloyl-ACP methyl ester carboxylesterase n=1 Tax=Pontibacter ummariensis TaxID=1610492 RepID=A0A239K7Y9_9BACT|nr:alpha/beta fold hydrolase [Pontibacter ummariensis]PRY06036.1 pimeloyl-ACP methyl ester carboxylesterase [Pontibacter ummariensis]SNT14215.1 Pimeloyl-ACP methyl ester carboxylesterase [Pontibacter ummariensis]